jgi:hypothetical protein
MPQTTRGCRAPVVWCVVATAAASAAGAAAFSAQGATCAPHGAPADGRTHPRHCHLHAVAVRCCVPMHTHTHARTRWSWCVAMCHCSRSRSWCGTRASRCGGSTGGGASTRSAGRRAQRAVSVPGDTAALLHHPRAAGRQLRAATACHPTPQTATPPPSPDCESSSTVIGMCARNHTTHSRSQGRRNMDLTMLRVCVCACLCASAARGGGA